MDKAQVCKELRATVRQLNKIIRELSKHKDYVEIKKEDIEVRWGNGEKIATIKAEDSINLG